MSDLQVLLEWAKNKGVLIRKLGISPDNERCFVAVEDIEPGDGLISIPQSILLHAEVALNDSQYGEAFRRLKDEMASQADQRHLLCLLLLLEKCRDSASNWAPYMHILPKKYDDPFWWTPSELSLLRGTRLGMSLVHYRPALQQLQTWACRLEELYKSLNPDQPAGPLSRYRDGWAMTPEAACWARSTVWSRAFTVHQLADGKRNVVAMVPVLDMIDHSPAVEVVWHTGPQGDQDFQFVPLHGTPKGNVVYNNYGGKGNDEFLLGYGFAIPDNPADYFLVSLARGTAPVEVAQAAPQQAQQQQPQSNGHVPEKVPQQHAVAFHSSSTDEDTCSVLRGSSDSDEGGSPASPAGESASQMQQHAEELQRQAARALLGLRLDHHLVRDRPLPQHLLQSARVCLMPPSELYQLSGKLLHHARQQRKQSTVVTAAAGSLQPALGTADATAPSTAASHASMEVEGAAGALKRKQPDTPETGEARAVKHCSSVSFMSAMHVVPHSGGGKAGDAPASSTSLVLANQLLGTVRPAVEVAQSAASASATSASATAARTAQDLAVLVSLQKQLQVKLASLLPDAEVEQVLEESIMGHSDPKCMTGGVCAPASSSSQYAQLGLTYLQGQKSILKASLGELHQCLGHMLNATDACSCSVAMPGVTQPLTADVRFTCIVPSSAGAEATMFSSRMLTSGFPAHCEAYAAWLAQHDMAVHVSHLPHQASAKETSCNGDDSRSSHCKMCEVLCTPRLQALESVPASAPPTSNAARLRSGGTFRLPRAAGPSISAATVRDSRADAQTQELEANQPPPLPAGIAACLGLDFHMKYDPVSWGSTVLAPVKEGEVILRVAESTALTASSRGELLEVLLVSAHHLLEEMVAQAAALAAAQAGEEEAQVADAQPLAERDMLLLHLMHTVGSAPAARLPLSESEQVSTLLEMLEDSPVGSAYQDAFEGLQQDFKQLQDVVCNRPSVMQEDEGELSSATVLHTGMKAVLAWPGAFGLYCWAISVIDRCAVRLQTQHHHARPHHAGPAVTWAILPVVCAMPPPLREAAVHVELVHRSSGSVLEVRATCALEPGVPLLPVALLPVTDMDTLMTTYGPEAISWRKVLDYGKSAPQQPHEPSESSPALPHTQAHQHEQQAPTTSAAPGASPSEAGAVATGAAAGAGCTAAAVPPGLPLCSLAYELFISPSDGDPLCRQKLQVLSAAGFGTVHFLTKHLETEALVMSALKVCLADGELIMHPAVQDLLQLNSQLVTMLQEHKQKSLHFSGLGSGVPAGGLVTAGMHSEAGSRDADQKTSTAQLHNFNSWNHDGSVDGGVPRSFMMALLTAQQALIDLLDSLPEDHPAAVAARKQMRQIIHDARKHVKRRLRQMESLHQQQQQQQAARQARQAAAAAAQGSPEELKMLRCGVRLYLEELASVLDVWGDHLGLCSRQEPTSKNRLKPK
mmetsp:Transcript_13165/g.28231  ORF Transcript_13165/g.28231 Transcript_13165/m.28231 type:complete len:1436 (-) Transcript_13165:969-5276(-)